MELMLKKMRNSRIAAAWSTWDEVREGGREEGREGGRESESIMRNMSPQ